MAAYLGNVYALALEQLAELELPDADTSLPAIKPAWALAGAEFEMKARVIDYLNGGHGNSEHFANFLRLLGYNVTYDTAAVQHGASCGVVAAYATSRLQLAKQFCRPGYWAAMDLTSAVRRELIRKANVMFETSPGRQNDNYTRFHWNEEVQKMYKTWIVDDASDYVMRSPNPFYFVNKSPYKCAFCCTPDHLTYQCPRPTREFLPSALGVSFDHGMLQVAKMTQKFLAEATLSHEELFTTQIVNTEDSRSRGYHWFTIAISITRRRA